MVTWAAGGDQEYGGRGDETVGSLQFLLGDGTLGRFEHRSMAGTH